ncbi:MAG: chain length-determining protein [Gammaproteobacteria bacterium]|nr:chain length-determining protein [Gammaproteobacteria bacterium]
MVEGIRQLIDRAQDFWRYRWLALAIAWLVAIGGWIGVYIIPDQYQASARVYVDSESILRPLLKDIAVQPDVKERLSLMSRTLLSRPNLEKIARAVDFDINTRTDKDMEEVLDELTSKIEIESNVKEPNLYLISYSHHQSAKAKQVVQEALNIFMENTLGDTRKESASAQKFLEEQIREYEARLHESENKLLEFKQTNIGLMPDQSGGYYSRLQSLRDGLDQSRLELRQAEQERAEYSRQLAEAEAKIKRSQNFTSPEIRSLDQKIAELKDQLDARLLAYTEEHPEVVKLKNTITDLEGQRAREEARIVARVRNAPDDAPPPVSDLTQQLRLSLSQADARIASIKVRMDEYNRKVHGMESNVNTLPGVEVELQRLNRDTSVTKEKYEELLNRLESAKLSGVVGDVGDDIKFRVVDPPWVPSNPAFPNRYLLNAVVLLAALAAGIVAALFSAQSSPVIYDAQTLRTVTGLPVYGAVSVIHTAAGKNAMKKGVRRYLLAWLLLLVVYTGITVVQFVT